MDKREVIRKMKQIGARGRHYQFRELREALGLSATERNNTANLYNFHKSLINDGIVEELPGERERNKYYVIKDDMRLNGLVRSGPADSNGEPRSGPAGLARIESKLLAIEQTLDERLGQLEQKVDQLLAAWS